MGRGTFIARLILKDLETWKTEKGRELTSDFLKTTRTTGKKGGLSAAVMLILAFGVRCSICPGTIYTWLLFQDDVRSPVLQCSISCPPIHPPACP